MEEISPDPGGGDPRLAAVTQMQFWLQRSRWDKAAEEGRKALAYDPESATIHQSLGWAYWQLEDYKQAELHLRSACL